MWMSGGQSKWANYSQAKYFLNYTNVKIPFFLNDVSYDQLRMMSAIKSRLVSVFRL